MQNNVKYGIMEQEVNNMDNNDILIKYMEKVDRDQSDLKQDIRESEKRTAEHLKSVEERMDNRLNRIEDIIAKQTENLNDKIDSINTKIDSLGETLGEKIEKNNKFINTMSVTTIIGVSAITVAVVWGLFSFFTTILPMLQKALLPH